MVSQQQQQASKGIQALVYLLIGTEFIAATLSVLIIFALTIPLLIQLQNGSYYQKRASSAKHRKGQQEPAYSSYNLYLVYLGIVDLAFLLPTLVADLCTLTGNFNHGGVWSGSVANVNPAPPMEGIPMRDIVGYPYSVGNCWINAIIAYEIWQLLRTTHHGQRIAQPTLTKVNLEGLCVIGVSMGFGYYHYYMFSNNNVQIPYTMPTYFSIWLLLLVLPFGYAVGVTILVQRRGYMPSINRHGSTPRDKAIRGLALYFFRVVTVFVSIWLPAVGGELIAVILEGKFPQSAEYIFLSVELLVASQTILTFWMILGKDDVKKYIRDFVALSFLPGCCTSCSKKHDTTNGAAEENRTVQEHSRRRRSVTTILGYTFEDCDTNDANGDAEELEIDEENDNASIGDCNSADDNEVTSMVDSEDGNDGSDNNGSENNCSDNDDLEAGIASESDETGNYKYKKKVLRKGPTRRVITTGEAPSIHLQPEGQAEKA